MRCTMGIDLRVLRWCVIPAALLVCVTIVLWQLRTHETPPQRDPGQTRMKAPGGGSTQVVSSSAAIGAST
jgi:hypothetical protein